MCSVLGLLDLRSDPVALRARALELSRCMRHRGPDWSGVYADGRAVLAHERLAVVGVDSGAQPFVGGEGRLVLAVNGEVYNHRALRARYEPGGAGAPFAFQTASDCEVVLPLHLEHGPDLVRHLDGMFAFVLWDAAAGRWLVARDPIGVVPLYYGRDADGTLHVASELKALAPVCVDARPFPPGHRWASGEPEPVRYFRPRWRDYAAVAGAAPAPTDSAPNEEIPDEKTPTASAPSEAAPNTPRPPAAPNAPPPGEAAARSAVRGALEAAVHSHLMSDVPYGVLLSGGLDSSLVAALAVRHAARRVDEDDRVAAWWPRVHSFAVGLDAGPGEDPPPDLRAARDVAAHLGTVHHEVRFTLQEGIDALGDVIWHLETYDVTTVRASTPMYLMARRIRAMGVKMVLSGEGADELFGGYLYFHHAPNARALHEETVRKLDALHLYDCLRANKAMAAWGVEARVPFLDRHVVDAAMSLDPAVKLSGARRGRVEKQVLREAFAGVLPDHVLWRQKEQFSDGVGYGWIDALKAHAERAVTDAEFAAAAERFPYAPPATKEAYLYRTLFARHFPQEWAARTVPGGPSVACSTAAALEWDPALRAVVDPSGRAVRAVHQAAY